MFRSDRDVLSEQVDELRRDNERLRIDNETMCRELLARRAADPNFAWRNPVYQAGPMLDGDRVALSQHRLAAYPVWKAVLWHILTFGIASWFRFNLMHDQLPKAKHDDPSAFKALALHLAPYVNLYWVFFNGLRLADRINLQLRMRGEAPMVKKSRVIAAGVSSVVPYVNLFAAPIVWLLVVLQMQRAVNRVVALDEAKRAESPAELGRTKATDRDVMTEQATAMYAATAAREATTDRDSASTVAARAVEARAVEARAVEARAVEARAVEARAVDEASAVDEAASVHDLAATRERWTT